MAIANRLDPNPVNYYNNRGIVSWGPVNNIIVRNCFVHDSCSSGIRFNKADYITIEDCNVARTCWWMIFPLRIFHCFPHLQPSTRLVRSMKLPPIMKKIPARPGMRLKAGCDKALFKTVYQITFIPYCENILSEDITGIFSLLLWQTSILSNGSL